MKNHRSLALGAMILFGALLFGAPHAGADPVGPVGPTDIAIPTADPEPPLPPEPNPQIDLPATDIVAEEPCWQTDTCPPPVDPCEEEPQSCEPTDEPTEPEEPTDEPTTDPTPTSERPVDQPRTAPESVPTPSRIDTGAGPADPVNWLLIAVPALALLAMAGGGAYLWVARSERRR